MADAAATAEANASGGDVLAPLYFVPPYLPDDVACQILLRLPTTKDGYRVSAVCREWRPWRAVMSQPEFLCSYLKPLPVSSHGPGAVVVQPRRGVDVGYVHVAVVSTNPPGEDGVQVQPGLGFSRTGGIPVDRYLEPLKIVEELSEEGPKQAAVVQEPEKYAVFFEQTIPSLDLAVVASHGNLLLCRSQNKYHVCDPLANRWVELPTSESVLKPHRHTHTGFCYELVGGKVVFDVVLLARIKGRRIAIDTLTSTTATWEHKELYAPGAARCLGATSPGPGVHSRDGFHWVSPCPGYIMFYDSSSGSLAVQREPAKANNEDKRMEASRVLGCQGGNLRMCAVDIVYENQRLQVRLQVWETQGGRSPEWLQVHSAPRHGNTASVDGITMYGSFLIMHFSNLLSRYDLLTGTTSEIAQFRRAGEESRVDVNLYRRVNTFPLHIE